MVAGFLRKRADVFQPRRYLIRESPEIPLQHTGLPLIAVKAGIDWLIPAGVKAGMETGVFILHEGVKFSVSMGKILL